RRTEAQRKTIQFAGDGLSSLAPRPADARSNEGEESRVAAIRWRADARPDRVSQRGGKMTEERRPLFILLASHWVSMLGVALVTLAGFSWLFSLPAHMRGHVENPYIGLLVFVAIPIVFVAGLVLMPIGVVLAKRRVAAGLAGIGDRRAAARRTVI